MAGPMKSTNGFCSVVANVLIFTVALLSLPPPSHESAGNKPPVIDLHDGEVEVFSGPKSFCYQNTIVPDWKYTWTRIQIRVSSSKVFKVQIVDDEERLEELERFSFWGWFQSWLRERHNETAINVNLFSEKTCFRVDPTDKTQYTVKSLRKFDIYFFLVSVSGALLFIFADSLSRSQLFCYSAGTGIGMVASLIILFFVLARLLPKKSPFYVLIVGGWSFSLYAIQLVCRNIQMILREHWHLALGYVAVVGFISFAVCYRYGPLVNERSINILTWTLQLFSLLLIYAGIQIREVAFAIIIAAVVTKHLEYPVTLALVSWRKMRRFFHWKPEPRRLLTEEEYQQEAEIETRRALEELRKVCNSPDFSPWKTVSRLQSPKRFADFIEGSPHLMPNEVSVHAQEYGFGGSFFEDELFDTDDEDFKNAE